MLPFLRNKQAPVAGLIIKKRSPDQKPEESKDSDQCYRDLISAVKADDAAGVKAAMADIMNYKSEDETEDKSEMHSYDAQNQEAAD